MGEVNFGSFHPDGTNRAFHSVADHHHNPRHRQYSAAISPKLWACHCLLEGAEDFQAFPNYAVWERWKLPLRLPWCPRFAARYELLCLIGHGGGCISFSMLITRVGPTPTPRCLLSLI